MNRFPLWSIVALVICVGLLPQANAQTNGGGAPPNIIFAIADDWGFPHASILGDPVVQTPTFDRIANEGVLFTHAFVSSPSCTPSRAAIVTGQYHWRLEESANLWSTLQAKFPVYTDLLAEAGYHVGHSGKGWGPGRVPVGGRTVNPAGPRFKNFAEFMDQRPEGAPICYWLGGHDPHRPYKAGSGAESGMDLTAIDLPGCFPDLPEVRSDVADYYVEVQRFDRDVGNLLAELEQRGELDNTIVVMTGDHGMPFPRCKGNLYDTGARVPLAICWPRVVAPGRTVDDFISLTDLAPTFLSIVGLEPPDEMTGRSIEAILRSPASGQVDPARDHVITGKERHVPCQEAPDSGGTPMRAIRTADYLYIRNFNPACWPAGTPNDDIAFFKGSWYGDCDHGPTKMAIITRMDVDAESRRFYELCFAKRPAEELYDLRSDPNQLHNVADNADNAEYAEIKEQLWAQLETKLRETGDPRVVGGAEVFATYPYYGGGGGKRPASLRDR